ncbi:MAG: hypothetical protein NW203_04035 [Hyphomonadaceae bacterium]|nr:hypothetical protein [Hyphomonadaceae bacterium]
MTLPYALRAVIDPFWGELRAQFAAAEARFAALGFALRPGRLRRDWARIARAWIAGLEAQTRRLLLAAAAALYAPPAPPGRRRWRSGRGRAPDLLDPDPAAWRGVTFRLRPAPSRARGAHKRAERPRKDYDITGLARRCEALRRVLAEPESAIRRMAALLRRTPEAGRAIAARAAPPRVLALRPLAQRISPLVAGVTGALWDTS